MKRLLAGLVVVFTLTIGGLWSDYRTTIDAPLANRETVYFEIAKGQTLSTITKALHARGLIKKQYWFRLLAWTEKAQASLKYGEYEIPANTTPRQLLALFASGKVRHYSLTFVEGWNFRQMAEAINRQPGLAHHVDGKSPDEASPAGGPRFLSPCAPRLPE